MESIDWNFGNTISVLTLVIGILTFFWGIYIYRKAIKRPNKIKYIPGEFFNIFNALPGKFKEFEIKYKKESINNNIYYISGKIIEAGGDINTKNNKIYIELPEGCKWIDVSEDSSNELIEAKLKKDENIPQKATLTFNKFRKNNHIIIGGIIEGHKLSTDIHEKIKFNHNITKADDVKIIDKEDSLLKDILIYFFAALIIFAVGVFLEFLHVTDRSNQTDSFSKVLTRGAIVAAIAANITFLLVTFTIKTSKKIKEAMRLKLRQ